MPTARKSLARIASLVAIGSGSLHALRRLRSARSDHRLSILAYHDVCGSRGEAEGIVSADRLRRHLRYVKDNFRVVALSEGVAALSTGRELDEDLLAVTFDDGYLGNYEFAWPVLREEGIPATIFVATGFLDGEDLWFDLVRRGLQTNATSEDALSEHARRTLSEALGEDWLAGGVSRALGEIKYLDADRRRALIERLRTGGADLGAATRPLAWDNVRELAANGIDIGCHTVSHPILSQLSAEQQRAEIVGARDRIAAEVGTAPTSFAYPNGSIRDYDETTLAILREAGFTLAVTTARGANRADTDLLQLRRTSVGTDPNFVLAARLEGLFDEGVRSLLPYRMQHVH